MLVNKWIMFALSFIAAGSAGASWAGIGPAELGTGIAVVCTTLTTILHASQPAATQTIVKVPDATGASIITHT